MTLDSDKPTYDELLDAVAALLRQTADPDPTHPAYKKARENAAALYQRARPAV